MFYPQSRFRFVPDKRRKRKAIVKFILVLGLIATGGGGLVWGTRWVVRRLPVSNTEEQNAILELWKQRKYEEIITITEAKLEKKPMDPFYLTFNGFAHFYRGVNQATTEQKVQEMDRAIVSLRRAKLSHHLPLKGEVDYILGKAYFLKGPAFSDLSIQYLEESLKKEYVGADTYEYLGLGYMNLSDLDNALSYFLKALENNSSDLLLLTIGQTYYQQGDKGKAEEFLMRSINKSQDPAVQQKARFLLGDIYFQNKDYLKAEEQFKKILDLNTQNADAHYFLGEIYAALGDTMKARSYWRRAVRINPKHYGALKRLYG
jgi:tetratricopeptide (TPR) repeat protein